MNSPVIIAVVAAAVTIALYYACGRISNKYARGVAQLATVFLGVVIAGLLSANNEVATAAGQYFFGVVVAFVVLGKIFGGKKPDTGN
jgi:hypothetical protein